MRQLKHVRRGLLLTALGTTLMVSGCGGGDKDKGNSVGNPDGGGGSSGDNNGGTAAKLNLPGDGDGDGGLDTNTDGGCGTNPIAAEQREVSVLLVVDRSDSMLDESFGNVVKWTALKQAINSAVDDVKADLNFGLLLYPRIDGDESSLACEVPSGDAAVVVDVAPGTDSAADIKTALNDNAPPNNGLASTPTAVALRRARDYFTTGAGKDAPGDRVVLLATDGGPNCNSGLTCDTSECTSNIDDPSLEAGACAPAPANGNCCAVDPSQCLDDARTTTRVGELSDAGIQTIVVGIPGSEAYETTLNALAEAGGFENPDAPPSYFAIDEAGGVQGLTDVLSQITKALIKTCELQLDERPPNPDKINVEIDGETIPQLGDDGWELDLTADPPIVRLKGATCDQVETQGAQSVKIVFGCPTVQ